MLEEWDYEKNVLTPETVYYGEGNYYFWKCKNGHSWQAKILNRTTGNRNCPYCSNHLVLKGYNDLASQRPDIAAEWHPTKNNNIQPSEVNVNSNKKIWWLGKCGHEWETSINTRVAGHNCPYCTGRKLLLGFNDLESQKPELAMEWNYIKNHPLLPSEIHYGSNKKVWWQCPDCKHEWQAVVADRVNGNGCPSCNSQGTSFPEISVFYYVSKIYPNTIHRYKQNKFEIDIYIPDFKIGIEYDSSYYHKNKLEKENQKDQFCKDNGIRLIRLRSNELRQTILAETIWFKSEKYEDLSEGIKSLFDYLNIKYDFQINIKNDYDNILCLKKIIKKKNNFKENYPEIAAEWHPIKNNSVLPEQFSSSSNYRAWWQCSEGHEWQTAINHRVSGTNCPYCSGRLPIKGETDLFTTYPQLINEWNFPKNQELGLFPENFKRGSGKKVWWQCKNGHEWQAKISNRTILNRGCPHCFNQRRKKG